MFGPARGAEPGGEDREGFAPLKTRLTHVRVNVHNLQQAVTWYSQQLGLEVKAYWPPDDPNYAEFTCEQGAAFSIMQTETAPTSGRFNFSVADVDALWGRLRSSARIVEPVFDTPYGTRKFTILDPDGNELGFVQD
jgi:predicted enzyme related to lactoylglutathione lyase